MFPAWSSINNRTENGQGCTLIQHIMIVCLFAQRYVQTQIKENIKAPTSLAFVRVIHRSPMNSPQKGTVTRKMFPFDDVIMRLCSLVLWQSSWDQHGAHLGPVGPRWAPCWPHAPCYLALRWRHNDHAGVSNHQPRDCLLNRLFRRRSKKTSKLRVTGLCAGNSPGAGEFPAQMASNAENVSIWWRHHGMTTAKQKHNITVSMTYGLYSLPIVVVLNVRWKYLSAWLMSWVANIFIIHQRHPIHFISHPLSANTVSQVEFDVAMPLVNLYPPNDASSLSRVDTSLVTPHHWTYKMPVRYILSSVWVRLSIFSQ